MPIVPYRFCCSAFAVLELLLAGCQSPTGAGSRTATSAADVFGLTPYQGPMRVLFDDAIDPEVFSTSAEASLGTSDKRLSERIRSSAFVVAVVVATVTDENTDTSRRLELELMPVEQPVHGSLAPYVQPGEAIKVKLGAASAGYALIRSSQSELVGKRMNLCWAKFSDGAEAVEHWHAFADTPKTRLAIAKAAAIVDFD